MRNRLFALFSEMDAHERGRALERVLNDLFKVSDIAVSEPFVVTSPEGKGVLEQVDGAVEIDGQTFLVEMKWWKGKLGKAEVASHLVSVYGRADVGGIFISAAEFHESAVASFREALTQKTVVLVELREIVDALTQERPLAELLRLKVREANLRKEPLSYPYRSS